jgi:hypothetical protein
MQVKHFMNKRRSESFNRRKVYLGHPFATLPSTNMLKINQHTTKLSKALLTAGLLGGAAVATLGAGSAQAAWTPFGNGYQCEFVGLGGSMGQCEKYPLLGATTPTTVPTPGTLPTEIGIFPSDKVLTLLDWGSIADGSTLQFTYQTPDSHPWHVDVDLAGNDTDGGFLKYTMDITDPNFTFSSAALMGAIQSNNPSVNKKIYSDSAFTNLICDITIGPSANQTCDISGKQIWVQDTWFSGQGVDNFSNDFAQVPGPLPLLGVGAAFGFSRKLRKRIKGSGTAEMMTTIS